MITVDHLTKSYRGVTAVDDVSFTARPGRVTGFLGPNGAGKSTTMRIMVGLTPASSGRVDVLGGRYADLPNPGREVGVLLDASAQHAGRTGREILTLAARTMGLPASRVAEMLRAGVAHREGGRPPGPQLLARHAAAARHRHRADRRPGRADPRRAGQRARPGRHPLDARPAAGVRRPGRHRAALLPPAARDRGHRRRPRGHRPRPDRRPGHQAGAAVGGRHGRLRPRRRRPGRRAGRRRHRRLGLRRAARSTPTPTPTRSAGSPWRPASP